MEMKSICINIAPMEGMTTFPMRTFIRMTSNPDGATTPFLRITKTFPLSDLPTTFFPEMTMSRRNLACPVIPQFMTCDPENLIRTSDLLPDVPIIELNCGCPTPNAAGRNAGSGILQNADEFIRTIDFLCKNLGPGRLAVKMRVGFHEPDEFPTLLAVARLPLARLTVHGRTRKERYTGRSRWDLIDMASRYSRTPVFGSGDIMGWESFAENLHAAPLVSGVFVGRGLLSNPWLISELKSKQAVKLSLSALILAISNFGLLHELALTRPEKLLKMFSEERVGQYIGVDEAAWEASTLMLLNALGMPPTIISKQVPFPSLHLSHVSFARVRILWNYMRAALPDGLNNKCLLKAKTMDDLIREIWLLGGGYQCLNLFMERFSKLAQH